MYWNTIMKEIKELESLNIDRKDYKEKVIWELERVSKEMSDNIVISSVLLGTDIRLATVAATKLKQWIDAYINKYKSNG